MSSPQSQGEQPESSPTPPPQNHMGGYGTPPAEPGPPGAMGGYGAPPNPAYGNGQWGNGPDVSPPSAPAYRPGHNPGPSGGYNPNYDPQAKSKLITGLLGIFLGGFGIHRFYLGFNQLGVIQLIVTLVTCGLGSIWGFVEGILYLMGYNGYTTDSTGRPLKD